MLDVLLTGSLGNAVGIAEADSGYLVVMDEAVDGHFRYPNGHSHFGDGQVVSDDTFGGHVTQAPGCANHWK